MTGSFSDWVSGSALVVVAASWATSYYQIREQRKQFDLQLASQHDQFEAQLKAQAEQFEKQLAVEREKIGRLEGLKMELDRQSTAQESQARATEAQNALLEQSTAVQREQLERTKRSIGRKIRDAIRGR